MRLLAWQGISLVTRLRGACVEWVGGVGCYVGVREGGGLTTCRRVMGWWRWRCGVLRNHVVEKAVGESGYCTLGRREGFVGVGVGTEVRPRGSG